MNFIPLDSRNGDKVEITEMKKGDPSEQTAKLQSNENDSESEIKNGDKLEITEMKKGDPSEQTAKLQSNENNSESELISDLLQRKRDEINKMEEADPSENNEDHILYQPLLKAIQDNNWKSVEDIVTKNRNVLTATININKKETFFHIITRNIKTPISLMEKLLEEVTPESLEELKDSEGESVIFNAARYGNRKSVEALVRKNEKLPDQKDAKGNLPIQAAAFCGNKETSDYLLSVTKTELDDCAVYVLSNLINSGIYGVALDVLKRYSKNIARESFNRGFVLLMLANKPLAFESGSRMGYWKRLIYKLIPVQEEQIPLSRIVDGDMDNSSDQRSQELIEEQRITLPKSVDGDMENPSDQRSQEFKKLAHLTFFRKISIAFGDLHQNLHVILWKALMHLAPSIKRIHDAKLVHKQTLKIVRMVCHDGIIWSNKEALMSLSTPFIAAARLGIYELVHEILEAYFYSFTFIDNDKHGIFELAILHRHEKLFSLVKKSNFPQYHLTGASSNFEESNILHVAAKYVPSSEISGAALQMQRELQWFKAVESYVHPSLQEQHDEKGKTPRQVFTKEHEILLEKGEKWMKDTASSCTLVAALIITVVFAAAFTAPGGNNSVGIPMFLHQPSFLVFSVSDSLALFSSTTSLLMFLGILTSRYAEDDFLESLPKKLIIGLITLFFSIATLMIAFGATIYIFLSHPWKWVIIPISLLACVPVTLFGLLQFPLLLEIYSSTFRSSILQPSTKKNPFFRRAH